MAKAKENKAVDNSIKKERTKKNINSSIKKLKLLVTVVDRNKALFYSDLLEGYEVNMQTVVYGTGTADKDMLHYLGLASSDKAVILSFVREDMIKKILDVLSEKFEKVKNGKGIAFTIPVKSLIGVSIYGFLSNNTSVKKEEKN